MAGGTRHDDPPHGDAPGHPHRDPQPGDAPGDDGQDAIEKSLHSALSDLERMLGRREGGEAGSHTAEGAPGEPHDDAERYTIPLLDEVVIPGTAQPDAHRAAEPQPDAFDADEPALRRRIAARLASEVEVIVQDRIEEALEAAREEIRKRVRDHMDITLPEIVDDLLQARRRKD